MSYLAKQCTSFFVHKNMVSADDREIFEYGTIVILSTLFSLLYIIAIGIIIHQLFLSIIFLIELTMIKMNIGGYHAKSYLRCTLMTLGAFLLSILVYQNSYAYSPNFWIISGAISLVIVAILAPESSNKTFTKRQRNVSKGRGVLFTLFFNILALVLYYVQQEWYRYIYLLILIATINLILGYLERGLSNEKN